MKYLEYPSLSQLSRSLSHSSAECTVHTRIEAYSCKPINKDKKLQKHLEHAFQEELAQNMSPPAAFFLDSDAEHYSMPLDSPFGPLDQHQSRKTLYLLISTLNLAFPDHDFSDVRPDHFSKEESGGATVLNSLSTTLTSLRAQPTSHGSFSSRSYSSFPPTTPDFFPRSYPTSSSPVHSYGVGARYEPSPVLTGTHPTLYRILDDVITLSECEVFSYTPAVDSDPHAGDSDSDSTSDASSASGDFDLDFDPEDHGALSSSPSKHDDPLVDSAASWGKWEFDEDESPSQGRPIPFRRRRGGLLWSSHWFFLHKKQKKILFISVWARKKSGGWVGGDDTFAGWDGAAGTGARALGLNSSGNL
ncbi:hypothetical protein BOTBODRAFT_107790 [Botryobasidium botryosum FD-172 SS1]|uniref:Repressor of RNA polymerase III transcription MAF1 n=1 Tax=Botryobasidium botryosum (strain FD-172 SS1) TaxID=930990 RepID=A0A067MMN2_BOTB1|nr:hypothetical protein BOTBODRAFT_107790 [Botryobasidium botryosum FD-172 SS1]